SATAVVHTPPADPEGAFPLRPVVGDEAAATADAGVVEHEVDVVGGVAVDHLVAERDDLFLHRDVAEVVGHASATGGHVVGQRVRVLGGINVQIAERDRTAFTRELHDELAPHAAPAPGHHGQLPLERLHGRLLPRSVT